MSGRVIYRKLIRGVSSIEQIAKYSSAAPKFKVNKGPLLISCQRKALDHYLGTYYDKLDEVPLASKGWNHSKAKNDYFTVLPLPKEYDEVTYSFMEFGIHSLVIDALKKQDIKKATEFQSRAIRTIQKGVHTLLAAETGCGKTISYILPIIQGIVENKKSTSLNTPRAVILVPNRELAYQAGEMAELLCDPVGVTVKTLVGGKTKSMMMNPDFSEIDILVSTPGALGKLSTVGIFKLNEVQWLVLDEADTLVDDSFIERMESLIKRMSQAQVILVTATLPRKLPNVLTPYEETMEQVISPRIHRPLLNITQKFMRITKSMKPANLLQVVKVNKDPLLIFTNRNQTCNWLAMFLRENGVPCANINGDMNYAIRIDQWNQFIRGEAKVLSATDVGSRGLNTVQVKHVLNYDFPLYMADYIHRVGRVGRLGSPNSCKVTNFICGSQEVGLVQQVELSIRRNQALTNVDGNITNIVQNKILRKIREDDQIYKVVADIKHYKQFLPFCTKSTILSHNDNIVHANLEIGFPPVVENYTSKVTLVDSRLVKAQCNDGRLFNYLETTWKFAPGLKSVEQSCIIDFYVKFEFKSLLYSQLATMFFDRLVKQMESAFIEEARRRFGKESIPSYPLAKEEIYRC